LIPGEIPAEKPVELDKTGIEAAAAWSLYPLADDGSPHMGPIYAAIDEAKASGITVTSEHYATILRGDLADVLTVIVNAWAKVGEEVPHVSPTYRSHWTRQVHNRRETQHDRYSTTAPNQVPQPL